MLWDSRKAKQYLPSVYRGVLETDELFGVIDADIDDVEEKAESANNNQFVETSDILGLQHRENSLGIIPDPSTEDIEFRRARIMARYAMTPPFTLRFLRAKLNTLIGEGQYTLTIDYGNRSIIIGNTPEDYNWFQEVRITLFRMKPCNMTLAFQSSVFSAVKAAEEISKAEQASYYKLGQWVLSQYPFVGASSSEVIKLPTVPSIKAPLLADLATFSAGEITNVCVFDNTSSFVITDFIIKAGSANIATISYNVDPAESGLSTITKIQLRDSANNVLTESIVYVPATELLFMEHKITFKEGA